MTPDAYITTILLPPYVAAMAVWLAVGLYERRRGHIKLPFVPGWVRDPDWQGAFHSGFWIVLSIALVTVSTVMPSRFFYGAVLLFHGLLLGQALGARQWKRVSRTWEDLCERQMASMKAHMYEHSQGWYSYTLQGIREKNKEH